MAEAADFAGIAEKVIVIQVPMKENGTMYSKAEDMRRTVVVAEDEITNLLLLGGILSIEYNVLTAENGVQALKILKEMQEGFPFCSRT